jgi:hypothetical protein
MRYSRRDSRTGSSPKRYARLRRGGMYWTGLGFAVVLFGVGIAGLVFGHRYAGGFGVLVGGAGLLAGARDWSRRRHAARPGRIPQLSLRHWPPPSVHVVLVLGYPRPAREILSCLDLGTMVPEDLCSEGGHSSGRLSEAS